MNHQVHFHDRAQHLHKSCSGWSLAGSGMVACDSACFLVGRVPPHVIAATVAAQTLVSGALTTEPEGGQAQPTIVSQERGSPVGECSLTSCIEATWPFCRSTLRPR
jgi:hypothetical protein